MKKKNIYYLTLTVIAILIVAFVLFYMLWTSPYNLPKIKNGISPKEYGVVFNKEKRLVNNPVLHPESKARFPETPKAVTVKNDKLAYYFSLSAFKGENVSKKKALNYLEASVKADPGQMVFSNTLRLKMSEDGRLKQYINFLDSIKKSSVDIQLQKALAYVDMLQNPRLGTASMGQKSRKSMQILSGILKQHPYNVLAHYARGLNNLYWPSGLQRTQKAIQDLAFCVAVAKKMQHFDFPLWPVFYTAYGDALIKNGDVKEGMAVWKDGFRQYPDNQGLRKRVKANKEEAYRIVKHERGVDTFRRPDPDITDLSVLWEKEN